MRCSARSYTSATTAPKSTGWRPRWCRSANEVSLETSSVLESPDGEPLYPRPRNPAAGGRSEEHTSELQSLMRISYAVFCLKKKTTSQSTQHYIDARYYLTNV